MSGRRLPRLCDAENSLPISVSRLQEFPDDPIACMRKLQSRHGNVAALEQDGSRIYFAFGPEMNHQILSDTQTFHSRFFALRGGRRSAQRRLTSGLLSMNGEGHKRNRRLTMEAFQRRRLYDYLPTIQRLTEDMVASWSVGQEMDLNQEMTEYMLRVTSSILFGIDDGDLAVSVGRMIDHWVHLNHEAGIRAFIDDDSLNDKYEELQEYANTLDAAIADLIERRRNSPSQARDVLSILLEAHDEQGAMSDAELIGQAALIFGAAHLTTAHTLTWTQLLLAEHPDAMTKLCDALDEAPVDAPETCTYLDYVIKESMRVMPASSYSQRVNSAPARLGPFDLAPGSAIVFSQFMTHHMPELYPDPDRFVPERWETATPSAYAYLPFGAGARMCLGATLAWMIIRCALPAVLRRHQLALVAGSEINAKVISTMLCPTTAVPVTVQRPSRRFVCTPITGSIHDLVDLPAAALPRRRAA